MGDTKALNTEYCLYLRKSRADMEAEARGEGETLVRHERILQDLAKRLGLNITSIYREVVSGETLSSRPMMQHLLSEVEQGRWAGVLVMEVERLARGDTVDQGIVAQTFKYSGTRIITPMKVYDPGNEYDEEYFEFGLFMSRREYKTINRRLQRGRLSSVSEGKYVGSKPPYGYKRIKLENQSGFSLTENPCQADIVRLVFEWYTKGEKQIDGNFKRLGVNQIVRKLNSLHIPSQKGDVWVPATIQGMLRNPVYTGKIRWKARPSVKKLIGGQMKQIRPRSKDSILVDGLHLPIIDRETWNLTQHYLSLHSTGPVPSALTIKNPLSGLIVCGVCGRKLVRRPCSGNYPDTLLCSNTACQNVSTQLSLVEKKLIDSLAEWLKRYKLALEARPVALVQENVQGRALAFMNHELDNLEKQMNSLHDLLERGIYSTEKFLERSKILNEKIGTLTMDRKNLMASMETLGKSAENEETLIPKVERILDVYWYTQHPGHRNELLKEIVDKAVYTKIINGRWHGHPDDFELVLFPRLPE